MRHIPNFITSLNLASGFIAIILAASGNIETASWLILAAMIFDFLDGFSARMLKAYSAIGKELDSLADVVSFGVAPAIIIYKLMNESLSIAFQGSAGSPGFIITLVLFSPVIMPVFAALRLAIFNTDESQATSFKGVPTPANALAVITLVIAARYTDIRIIESFLGSPLALTLLVITLSLLMVSRLPMLSLKTSHLRFKGNEGRYGLILLIILAIVLMGFGAIALVIPLYIIVSLVSAAILKEK